MIDKLAEHIRNKYKYTKFTTDEELEAITTESSGKEEESAEKE